MLDPIVNFFTRIFQWIGRGIGLVIGVILWPFMWAGRWYTQRGWILKAVLGLALLVLVGLYGYFIWNTQVWTNFNPVYAEAYDFTQAPAAQPAAPAQPAPAGADVEGEVKTCTISAIAQVAADLIDFNVNENAWISSMILYKAGFFGMDWDRTPFLDNKASFQRGVNQAIRRTSVELVDTLGRVRGTSQIDQNLQDARGAITFDEETWYFGLRPFGPKTPTPSFYRTAARSLRTFNDRLQKCEVVFNARADNLMQFVDRIASDIGSTSDMIRDRSQNYNSGWFDTRADDRFWFAYGQLYGYYGILTAAHHDFRQVIDSRGLGPLWSNVESQIKAALAIRPFIISNGREDGWIMPTHLTTMGFYVLRVRSNLVEVRSVLDR
ncbi:DUF2333 family protein [Allomesorhizobium camelthorni]|uniref:DUF2333 family protein n=1 Tax=Allomesorhizobium camelthorni TaxID=475069 RepID=A0A6G4WIG1_9HYPH|nr:DUF2333 family protein [Mesorhizobium camelthorni]NGO54585.1 DUF2333 family protein [Mesorhizobium camelthorni]